MLEREIEIYIYYREREREESKGDRKLEFPSKFIFGCCFKVRPTFIVFGFEDFSILRFKVMFEYYEKMDFGDFYNCKDIFFNN
jgi:hypothetical protein